MILAGVSINLVVGNNGIITKARDAKKQTEQATATLFLRSALVQRSFSARKIVENNECRTSNHRAQHEAKRDLLNINGKVSPQSFFIELFFFFQGSSVSTG